MFTRFAALALSFLQAKEGVVAIQMALMMPLLIGMGALAIDVGFVLEKQRQMQSAADAAAYSAAIAKTAGYPAAFSTEAYAVAGKVGFVNGANGVTVTVNNPPVSPLNAANAANASAIQVIVQQPQTLPLVGAVCSIIPGATCSGTFNVAAQAVATAATPTTPGACDPATNPTAQCTCALQLSPTANPGITISGGATVNLTSCGVQACSANSTQAILMNGGATITTQGISSAGAMSFVSATVNTTTNTYSNIPWGSICPPSVCTQKACAAGVDPYKAQIASLILPAGGCSLGSGQNYFWAPGNPAYTFSPGVWCNGVTLGWGLTYKLNPGVYYVNGGTFNLGGGATLIGTGVTIVLTGSGSNYANVNIGGGANVTLTAPTRGTTSGIVFLGDPNGPLSNTNTFQGGSQINITGADYFPSETVLFNNGSSSNSSGCTQIIGGVLNFQGGISFNSNCAGTGTTNLGGTASGGGGATALVE